MSPYEIAAAIEREQTFLLSLRASAMLKRMQQASSSARAELREGVQALQLQMADQRELNGAVGQLGTEVAKAEEDLKHLVNGKSFSDAGMGSDRQAELRIQLARLSPGDTFRVRAGRFQGPFVIPAGVCVVGDGSDHVLFEHDGSDDSAPCVTMHEGSSLTGVSVMEHGRTTAALHCAAGEALDEIVLSPTHPRRNDAISTTVEECAMTAHNRPALQCDSHTTVHVSKCDISTRLEKATAVLLQPESCATLLDSSVVLNGGHHTNTGDSSVGIAVNSAVLEVFDCSVFGFGRGIRFAGDAQRPSTVSGTTISRCTVAALDSSSGGPGIMASSLVIDGCAGAGCIFGRAQHGIWLRDVTVRRCGMSGVVLGSSVDLATTNTEELRVEACGQYGLLLLRSSGDAVAGSWVSAVTADGRFADNSLGQAKVETM